MKRTCLFLLLALPIASCAPIETTLLYHPAAGDPVYDPPPQPIQDLELPMPDGTKIHARWAPHPQATGAVLYCHGNGGNIERYGKTVREIWENLHESVLIIDYPGYGYSQGKPSEAGCDAAGEAAYQWLTQKQKIAPGRIVIMGESLGGGVAVNLASTHDYRALVLVRTFTSIAAESARTLQGLDRPRRGARAEAARPNSDGACVDAVRVERGSEARWSMPR